MRTSTATHVRLTSRCYPPSIHSLLSPPRHCLLARRPSDVLTHPSFALLANSEQPLNSKMSRRLITMKKTGPPARASRPWRCRGGRVAAVEALAAAGEASGAEAAGGRHAHVRWQDMGGGGSR